MGSIDWACMGHVCGSESDRPTDTPRSVQTPSIHPPPQHPPIPPTHSAHKVELMLAQLTEASRDKDAVIATMQAEMESLRGSLARLRVQDSLKSPRNRKVVAESYEVEGDGVLSRARVGRHASVATSHVLSAFPPEPRDELALKMIEMFRRPLDKIEYLNSPRFAQDLLQLCAKAKPHFEAEPRCLALESPSYVFGDIHGNLEDLNFFADHLWRLGTTLTAGRFLFLGACRLPWACVDMDGWMDGWMDEWMDKWMDKWMDACVSRRSTRSTACLPPTHAKTCKPRRLRGPRDERAGVRGLPLRPQDLLPQQALPPPGQPRDARRERMGGPLRRPLLPPPVQGALRPGARCVAWHGRAWRLLA